MTRRSVPIKNRPSTNAQQQRAAIAKMSDAEKICGLSVEELDAQQAKMRAEAKRRLSGK